MVYGGPGPKTIRSMLGASQPKRDAPAAADQVVGDPSKLAATKARHRKAYRSRSEDCRGSQIKIIVRIVLVATVATLAAYLIYRTISR